MVINTEADVIRVIRENPRLIFRALYEDRELLNEVRRLVLTEELLTMPGQLSEALERLDRMEGQVKDIKGQVKDIEGQVKDITDHLGHLRGAELEREIVRIMPSRLNRMYDLYCTRIVQRRGDQTLHTEPFLDAVEDAEISSVISSDQRARIEETDMVVRARRQQEDRETIYIAVEASTTIRQSDITRAKDSAMALQTVFEVEAVAVAAGYGIRSEDRQRAERLGVAIVILDYP